LQVNSIQKILALLADNPLEQVDFVIQLAECLFLNSQPMKDMQDQLMAAMDILVDLDPTVDPDEEEGNLGGALGEGSQASGSQRSSQMKSSAGQSQVSGSARSSGRSGASGSKRGSQRGSSQKESSQGGGEEASGVEKLSVTTLLKLGRICAMLGLVAPTVSDQVGCCLMARHYWNQIFRMHFEALVKVSTPEAREEAEKNLSLVPSDETVTSWLEYPLPMLDLLTEQAKERAGPAGKLTLASDTLDDGNLTLVYLRYATDVLREAGHLAHCLVLTGLTECLGAGAMRCVSVKPLERLRAASILDELNCPFAFQATAPSSEELRIPHELLGERRIEMQRRVQVKKTADEEAAKAEEKKGKKKEKKSLKGAIRMVESVQSMGGKVVKEKTKKRFMQPLTDRAMWQATAEAALDRGEFKVAKELVHIW